MYFTNFSSLCWASAVLGQGQGCAGPSSKVAVWAGGLGLGQAQKLRFGETKTMFPVSCLTVKGEKNRGYKRGEGKEEGAKGGGRGRWGARANPAPAGGGLSHSRRQCGGHPPALPRLRTARRAPILLAASPGTHHRVGPLSDLAA